MIFGPLLRIAADIFAKLSPCNFELNSGLHFFRCSTGIWWLRKMTSSQERLVFSPNKTPSNGIRGGLRRLEEVRNPLVLCKNTNLQILIAEKCQFRQWLHSYGEKKLQSPGKLCIQLRKDWVKCSVFCTNAAFLPRSQICFALRNFNS